jgi:hypothetical protein
MHERKFERIGPSNDEGVWAHSLIENSINPHCVLVLIEYRINLLLFVLRTELFYYYQQNRTNLNINPCSKIIH